MEVVSDYIDESPGNEKYECVMKEINFDDLVGFSGCNYMDDMSDDFIPSVGEKVSEQRFKL